MKLLLVSEQLLTQQVSLLYELGFQNTPDNA